MNRTLLALVLASAMIPSTAPAQDVLAGAERYIQHCATCHGLSGTGDGPTAAILTLQPTDLTALASAEGGVFSGPARRAPD